MILKFNSILYSALLGSVLSLSACVSVLPKPKAAPIVYRLSIPKLTTSEPIENTKVVNIEFPTAPRALAGIDIILSPDGRTLTAAAEASWAEPVPNQIRNVLIEHLAKDGRITGVIPKGSTRTPYRLNMEIRRFEAVFENGEDLAPSAVVHLNLTLTDTSTRRLMGSHSVSTKTQASAKTISAIVHAQDKSTNDAMSEIAAWLIDILDNKS